jgi:hypothetical protein
MTTERKKPSTDLSELKARIVRALTEVKTEFASPGTLGIKTEKSRQTLDELVKEGAVKRFGNSRAVYRLAERCSQAELNGIVANKIRSLRRGSIPSLISLSKLDEALKKVPPELRERKMEVVRQLSEAKELLLLKHGKAHFLIFVSTLVDYLQPVHDLQPLQSRSDLPERVLLAYKALSDEQRTPDVPISDLYSKVGGSLGEFHDFLTRACLDHRAVPTGGEPVFASPEARERALHIEGKMFLNIKFV